MEKKKGFTLVELLGVIIVLAIVMGLAVVAYIGMNGMIDETYYHSLEESLKMAGADYFYYNKGEAPKIFGEQKEVTAKVLEENKYMQNGIKDKNGDSCNLEESKVIAYKDSNGVIGYHSCIVCGEYKTTDNDAVCRGEIDYTLRVRGKKESTNEAYNLDGSSWSNKNIIVTFETANDINTVYVKGAGTTKSCQLQTKGIVKSCEIKLETTGTYTYNFDEQNKDDEKSFSVKIDKVAPTFSLSTTADQHLAITGDTLIVNNTIQNVTDNDSKIKMIEYSFEKQSDNDNYKKLDLNGKDNNITIPISKTLNRKIYKLKVRAYDNAGNVSTVKEILYDIYKRVTAPTSGSYCRSGLVYSGYSQNLVYSAGEGYTFSNTTATDAGYHTVYANLLAEGYRWSDDTTDPKTISCCIDKATVSFSISPTSGSVEEGGTKSFTATASVYGTFYSSTDSSYVAGVSSGNSGYSKTFTVYGYNAGSTSIRVSFTPSDTQNYKTPTSKSFSITVKSPPPPPVEPDPDTGGGSSGGSSSGGSSSGGTVTPPVEPSNPETKTVKYTVLHQRQNDDGSYATYEQESGTGTVGSTITPPVKDYSPNWESPPQQTITLQENASLNVVFYKYERKCKGTFCSYCDYGSPLGECLYNKRNVIKNLWESGLEADSSNQNVRYINKPTNNYICFGVSSKSECSNGKHRIIGVFGRDHEVRLIRLEAKKSVWNPEGTVRKNYLDSKLKKNLEKFASDSYGNKYVLGTSSTWDSIVALETHGSYTPGCTVAATCDGVNVTEVAWKNSIDDILTREVTGNFFDGGLKYYPASWSDVLLATGNSRYSFQDDYSSIKNQSWLHDSEHHSFSYHMWNLNFAYIIGKGGRLCGCSGDCGSGNKPTSSSCAADGYYVYENYYRLHFNLKSSVVFCGGSATVSDPIQIGNGSCTN